MSVIFGQIVIGSPGAGKTTYCEAMSRFLKALGKNSGSKPFNFHQNPAQKLLNFHQNQSEILGILHLNQAKNISAFATFLKFTKLS